MREEGLSAKRRRPKQKREATPLAHLPRHVAHYRASDKCWQSLPNHLFGSGRLAAMNAGKLEMAELGELLGLLHDLGKFSLPFQAYLLSAIGELDPDLDDDYVDARRLKGKIDHSTAGAQWAWRTLSKQGPLSLVLAQTVALCVASHHSGLIDCLAGDQQHFGDNLFARRMRKPEEQAHLAEVLLAADPTVLDRCNWLMSHANLTDRLAELIRRVTRHRHQDVPIGPASAMQQLGLLVRFFFSCLIDADRLDTARFEQPEQDVHRPHGAYASWTVLIERFEARLAAMPTASRIDELRRSISQQCQIAGASRPKSIYTLSVPTGGGKTLAVLRFALHHAKAHELHRIIFVSPFTSIIDQNAQVARGALEVEGDAAAGELVVLEHHGNVTPERETWRDKLLCVNWDAPVIHTTMVQWLESLFGPGTRGARRMHQLAKAVIVFDEVQTLPVRCVHLFNNAVNFLSTHCGSTVVLCTATQPLLHQVDWNLGAIQLGRNHELMNDVLGLFAELRRVEVHDVRRPGGWPHEDIARLAVTEFSLRGSCLAVVNTKRSARRLFEHVAQSVDQDALCILSTDQCAAHRKHELARVRERLRDGQPVLCISTQLIEAGVDIDFRVVIRFLAGLDSIAQAAGRCNRHGKEDRGHLYIVNPDEESLIHLPDIRLGRDKSQEVLDNYRNDPAQYDHDILGPQAIQAYYQRYLYERKLEMDYPVTDAQVGRDDSLLEMLARNQLVVKEHARRMHTAPAIPLRQSFATAAKHFAAIDAPTQSILVPYGEAGKELINDLCAAFDLTMESALLRRAQQYMVNVFPHTLRALHGQNALYPLKDGSALLHLDPRFYSGRFGVSTHAVNAMETLYDD